jgi:hypothetical protein
MAHRLSVAVAFCSLLAVLVVVMTQMTGGGLRANLWGSWWGTSSSSSSAVSSLNTQLPLCGRATLSCGDSRCGNSYQCVNPDGTTSTSTYSCDCSSVNALPLCGRATLACGDPLCGTTYTCANPDRSVGTSTYECFCNSSPSSSSFSSSPSSVCGGSNGQCGGTCGTPGWTCEWQPYAGTGNGTCVCVDSAPPSSAPPEYWSISCSGDNQGECLSLNGGSLTDPGVFSDEATCNANIATFCTHYNYSAASLCVPESGCTDCNTPCEECWCNAELGGQDGSTVCDSSVCGPWPSSSTEE